MGKSFFPHVLRVFVAKVTLCDYIYACFSPGNVYSMAIYPHRGGNILLLTGLKAHPRSSADCAIYTR
jgi:hypothetical protein